MTIMNTELYEALVAAGAPDDKAKAAANVVEEQNKRFDKIDRRFDKVDNDIETLRKDMVHGFDQANNRFDQVNDKFDQVNDKFDVLEKTIKSDIQHSQDKLFLRLGGLIIALTGVTIAINRLWQ